MPVTQETASAATPAQPVTDPEFLLQQWLQYVLLPVQKLVAPVADGNQV